LACVSLQIGKLGADFIPFFSRPSRSAGEFKVTQVLVPDIYLAAYAPSVDGRRGPNERNQKGNERNCENPGALQEVRHAVREYAAQEAWAIFIITLRLVRDRNVGERRRGETPCIGQQRS